jgi:ankyrin repeat-rich membrane spanning protein
VNCIGVYGYTSLIWACEKGYTNIVNLLLQHPDINVNCIGVYGYTPLIWACEKGYTNIVNLLLQHPDINVNLYHECNGMQTRSPLAWACQKGHTDIVVLLLQQPDINVNCIGNYGWTALECAIRNEHNNIVKIIKEFNMKKMLKEC